MGGRQSETYVTAKLVFDGIARIQPPLGPVQERRFLSIVALERPDRLRCRLLGPGGVTVLDVLSQQGQTIVIAGAEALRQSGYLEVFARALARDLRFIFRLTLDSPEGLERVHATFSDYRRVGNVLLPQRIEIAAAGPLAYRINLQLRSAALDVKLDPRLFVTPK